MCGTLQFYPVQSISCLFYESTEDWQICWYNDHKESSSPALWGGSLLTRYVKVLILIFKIDTEMPRGRINIAKGKIPQSIEKFILSQWKLGTLENWNLWPHWYWWLSWSQWCFFFWKWRLEAASQTNSHKKWPIWECNARWPWSTIFSLSALNRVII